MSDCVRVFVQTALVCLSAMPFAAVAPGVLDAHRARREAASALPTADASSLLLPQTNPLGLPLLSPYPTKPPR
jgi:hypothetical protein